MSEVKTKQASVEIQRLTKRPAPTVLGVITFELHPEVIDYTWQIEDAAGKLLGSLTRSVTRRLVPAGTDPFDFALAHALESLKQYEIRQHKVFAVKNWVWLD